MKKILLSIALISIMTSCKKNDDIKPEEPVVATIMYQLGTVTDSNPEILINGVKKSGAGPFEIHKGDMVQVKDYGYVIWDPTHQLPYTESYIETAVIENNVVVEHKECHCNLDWSKQY